MIPKTINPVTAEQKVLYLIRKSQSFQKILELIEQDGDNFGSLELDITYKPTQKKRVEVIHKGYDNSFQTNESDSH